MSIPSLEQLKINASPDLFTPINVGNCLVQHRVVLSPMTRCRADDSGVPLPFVKDYYAQRGSVSGTMLITESTAITPRARGIPNVPGIWASKQIRRWKEITAGIHANGSWIWLQLYATGRASRVETLTAGGLDLVSSSAVPLDPNGPIPRALRKAEIEEYIQDFVQAARNAMLAGFDGVEIHAAHGFLIDQFLQASCNQRTDRWGAVIENRARFGLTICKRVSAAIGSHRVGVKLSPWNTSHGMGRCTIWRPSSHT